MLGCKRSKRKQAKKYLNPITKEGDRQKSLQRFKKTCETEHKELSLYLLGNQAFLFSTSTFIRRIPMKNPYR